MIYITQLVYIREGQEQTFLEFESMVIPSIARYHGELLLRIRPKNDSVISSSMDVPYEIHFIRFDSDTDLERYMNDDDRKKLLHLKEQSVKAVLLVKGKEMM